MIDEIVGSVLLSLIGGLVLFTIMGRVVDFILYMSKPARSVLLTGLLILFCFGVYKSISFLAHTYSWSYMFAAWVRANPDAAAASQELNSRLQTNRCLVCGGASDWVLAPVTSVDSKGLYKPSPLFANPVDGIACDVHKQFLQFLKEDQQKPYTERKVRAWNYLAERYTGSGRADVKNADPHYVPGSGVIPLTAETERVESRGGGIAVLISVMCGGIPILIALYALVFKKENRSGLLP